MREPARRYYPQTPRTGTELKELDDTRKKKHVKSFYIVLYVFQCFVVYLLGVVLDR